MHRTVLLIIVVSSIVIMAGCGGGGTGDAVSAERGVADTGQVVGVWQISSNVTPVMKDIVFKQETTDSLALTFDADGTLEATELLRGADIATSQGSWSARGTAVEANWTACAPTLSGQLFGDTLILSANDGTPDRIEMHFSRVE